jgi:ribosomal protein S17
LIEETRPLSKLKRWRLVKILSQEWFKEEQF